MNCIYEFEVFPEDSGFVALPYDLDGATQGNTFGEACEMAADWLQTMLEYWHENGVVPPKSMFGHEPIHAGGQSIVVSASVRDAALASA